MTDTALLFCTIIALVVIVLLIPPAPAACAARPGGVAELFAPSTTDECREAR